MTWEHELEQVAELVKVAEEAAMSEVAAFGFAWPEEATSQAEFDEGDCEPFWEFACDLYEVGETWRDRNVLIELF